MTNVEKKELFLQIIENWFSDETGQINNSNCIGFYHFLIDCLDFERKYTLELEVGFHNFVGLIIYKLSELIYESPNLNVTKSSIIYSYPNIHPEQLDLFWGDLLSIYSMAKEEYFL
jgi:hypothetical protein